MAIDTVQNEMAPATAGPLSKPIKEAFIAYRRTRAEWDAYVYATPENEQTEDQDYCGANCSALNALLLTPAETLHDLALKLKIYNAEEIDDNWSMARPITALLAEDGEKLITFGRVGRHLDKLDVADEKPPVSRV